jgi:hypothetical protein
MRPGLHKTGAQHSIGNSERTAMEIQPKEFHWNQTGIVPVGDMNPTYKSLRTLWE